MKMLLGRVRLERTTNWLKAFGPFGRKRLIIRGLWATNV